MTPFIFIATVEFIKALINQPTMLMLYMSTIMIIPAGYAVLVPIFIKPLAFRQAMYYYLSLIFFTCAGSIVNLVIYIYALLGMDVIKWGKTRGVGTRQQSKPPAPPLYEILGRGVDGVPTTPLYEMGGLGLASLAGVTPPLETVVYIESEARQPTEDGYIEVFDGTPEEYGGVGLLRWRAEPTEEYEGLGAETQMGGVGAEPPSQGYTEI
jgi:hypothetical protein